MPVYKEKNGTWRSVHRYVDWSGENKQSSKRGFKTKKEGQIWENEEKNRISSSPNMTFESFVEQYWEDKRNKMKENTVIRKSYVIQNKFIPFFGKKKLSEITPKNIMTWQNKMIEYRDENGNPYSPVYLRSINKDLASLFNHAVKFYGLHKSPLANVETMGKAKGEEKEFWTKDEYLKFSYEMMDKPMSYYAFQCLYWLGVRSGELLALSAKDFNFEKGTVSITKSYQRYKKQDVITEPKTLKSNRIIKMPSFLVEEMQEYLSSFYKLDENARIFPITRSYLHSEMTRGAKNAGVKRISVHGIRHSAISLLIDLGFSAIAIADRVGHESIDITYRYAHLFPSKQVEMANKLDMEGSLNNVTQNPRQQKPLEE